MNEDNNQTDENELANSVSKSSKSPVFNHSIKQKDAKGKAVNKCNYCTKTFSTSSTNVVLRHLKSDHKTKVADILPKQAPGISKFINLDPDHMPFSNDVLIEKVANLIIKKDLPFSLIDDKHFNDLIKYLCPGQELISRRTMKTIANKFQEQQKLLIQRINLNSSKYSLTLDAWTSKNRLAFLGITIHWINEDWIL